MPNPDAAAWEERLIAELRANGGELKSGPLAGHPLLVMTNTGADSGKQRRAILTFHLDNGDYVVAGTAGGSPVDPTWVRNVAAHPDVTVEARNQVFPATATIVKERAERDRLWNDHVQQLPWFGDYESKTDRVFPIIRLTPKGSTTV